MAITKKQIIDIINAMPEDEFEDMDVLLERMIMLQKIEKAEKISGKIKLIQLKKPNNISHHGCNRVHLYVKCTPFCQTAIKQQYFQ
ncbi:hypothetical protein FC093_12720 [Ilyomonas limi]|uniref:Uncharacterized protein n=1 Tax=Ilyomonas limi TaxID=2575867 RepID=A0A4U3L1G9_9BACT|nr:hypothetical protein [Ilyomonas limi]TKK68069.1 hypothetical protein FC093_12720 [Ilyomonas limi]